MSDDYIIKNNTKKRAIALGSFDGMHRGHSAVVREALCCADSGFSPAILLLEPHPQKLLTGKAPSSLFCGEDKKKILESFGAEIITLDFSEIMSLSAEEFVTEILIKKLGAGALCCGYNYRFGKNGAGNAESLRAVCNKNGVELHVAVAVFCDGEPISSTLIRNAVASGEIDRANKLLGREFGYILEVVHGDNVGRRLFGVPTINQLFPPDFIVPCFGVYRSRTQVNGAWYDSVTNIGKKPTFGKSELRSETHIKGFDGDLYGQSIEVRLVSFVRPEKKFLSTDELKAQIKRDMEE